MTDVLLLLGMLVVLVLVACLMIWDLNTGVDRLIRRADVIEARGQRWHEDACWTLRELEYRHAMEITLTRYGVRTVDDLAGRLGLPQIESVA